MTQKDTQETPTFTLAIQPGEGAVFLTLAFALPAEEVEHVRALQDRTEESPDREYDDRSEEKEEFVRLLSTALARGVPISIPFASTAETQREYSSEQAGEAGVQFLRRCLANFVGDIVEADPQVALRALTGTDQE